ncbi:uncharacterized protein N7482_005161 [Penicillium canariense]|uniref:Uncharacterized protein n=1 Tax=Penicillium canariense TaxID=189055 RepID=A0A9W9I1W2_9EURO|nr:uncharacterized protein N7482_005161 [Penicillium canariense]KAJ5166380.1 hypothetical protein N7482_005161 [Penicillium canariense]
MGAAMGRKAEEDHQRHVRARSWGPEPALDSGGDLAMLSYGRLRSGDEWRVQTVLTRLGQVNRALFALPLSHYLFHVRTGLGLPLPLPSFWLFVVSTPGMGNSRRTERAQPPPRWLPKSPSNRPTSISLCIWLLLSPPGNDDGLVPDLALAWAGRLSYSVPEEGQQYTVGLVDVDAPAGRTRCQMPISTDGCAPLGVPTTGHHTTRRKLLPSPSPPNLLGRVACSRQRGARGARTWAEGSIWILGQTFAGDPQQIQACHADMNSRPQVELVSTTEVRSGYRLGFGSLGESPPFRRCPRPVADWSRFSVPPPYPRPLVVDPSRSPVDTVSWYAIRRTPYIQGSTPPVASKTLLSFSPLPASPHRTPRPPPNSNVVFCPRNWQGPGGAGELETIPDGARVETQLAPMTDVNVECLCLIKFGFTSGRSHQPPRPFSMGAVAVQDG